MQDSWLTAQKISDFNLARLIWLVCLIFDTIEWRVVKLSLSHVKIWSTIRFYPTYFNFQIVQNNPLTQNPEWSPSQIRQKRRKEWKEKNGFKMHQIVNLFFSTRPTADQIIGQNILDLIHSEKWLKTFILPKRIFYVPSKLKSWLQPWS